MVDSDKPSVEGKTGDNTPESLQFDRPYIGKLEPNDVNAPKFNGVNITDFLEEYNFEADRVLWSAKTRKLQLPYFCTPRYKAFVRKLPGYSSIETSWEEYQKELRKLYASQDENWKRSTRAFIVSYVDEVYRKQPMVKLAEYYLTFVTYFAAAQARNQVAENEKGFFFFRGLAREDMDRVMHHMPDPPDMNDTASFRLEEIYEFVRKHREQEEGLNTLNSDFSSVGRTLARKDAASLSELVPEFDSELTSSKSVIPGVLSLPAPSKPVAPKVDPAVSDLIRQFDGLTLTVEQFNGLATNNLALRRLLSNSANYAEAYKQLVLRQHSVDSGPLERNDGSFRSAYPAMINDRQKTAPPNSCRCCGGEGHQFKDCPAWNDLRRNQWCHSRSEPQPSGYSRMKYYFGPWPNEKWGVFPGGGFAPRPFGNDILEWILQSVTERFQVSRDQLRQHIKNVLPGWFSSNGEPIDMPRKNGSAESNSIEENSEGEALAQQTIALRAAAMFLEQVSEEGEVLNAEEEVYAVETRNKGVRKAADTHRKAGKPVAKKAIVPRMKNSRVEDQVIPTIEEANEDELLRHRAVVEIPDSVMEDAQVDPDRDHVRQLMTPARDSRSTTIGFESQPFPIARARKISMSATPTQAELIDLARNTSTRTLAKAILTQEVKGIRQVDLMALPEVSRAVSTALEEARKPSVRFHEVQESAETNEVDEARQATSNSVLVDEASLRRMYVWGTQSGETNAVGKDLEQGEVITSDVLRRLCPKLSRAQQALLARARAANSVYEVQTQDIVEEDGDGQSEVLNKQRQASASSRRPSLKGQLPTCWVTLHGGMGRALIDTGSQLNVMRLSTARALNVYITELNQSGLPIELQQGMITADGSMDPFVGTAYAVPIMVGGVLIPTHFRIVRKLRRAILLGTPWCAAAKLRIEFDVLGRALCYIKSLDSQREVSFVGCGRPGASDLYSEEAGNGN